MASAAAAMAALSPLRRVVTFVRAGRPPLSPAVVHGVGLAREVMEEPPQAAVRRWEPPQLGNN